MSLVFDALKAQNNRIGVEQPRRDIQGATRDSLMQSVFLTVDSSDPANIIAGALGVDITVSDAQDEIVVVTFVQDAPILARAVLELAGGVMALFDTGGGLSAALFVPVPSTTTDLVATATGSAGGILVPGTTFAAAKQAVSGATASNGVFVTGYAQRFAVDAPYNDAAVAAGLAEWPLLDSPAGAEITTAALRWVCQTGSDIVYGEQAYINTGGEDNTIFAPCVINEDAYTQAMKDNGDRFESLGNQFLVTGLYTLNPDNDVEGPAKTSPPN